jgi:hypothetical protein
MSQKPNDKIDSEGELRISQNVVDEYLQLRKSDLGASKRFYFEKIMPIIRPLLEQQSEHDELRKKKYSTLVSLMGFSPETTVQATLIIRPQKLIVVYSEGEKSKESAQPAIEYLQQQGIISPFDLTLIPIDAFDPQDIYDKLRKQIPDSDDVIMDITGGTKVMSATAGALAWEMNLTLCYLDGGWGPETGSAGLKAVSRLTVKSNPSRSRGYRYREEGLKAYESGNFIVAAERFNESRKLVESSYFDDLGLKLSMCYAALATFDRDRLSESKEILKDTLDSGGIRKLLKGQIYFDAHLKALERFATSDPPAMAAGFVEMAEVYARQQRYDLSGLLWYRAMEALVEIGVKRLAPKFNMSRPDWGLFADVLGLESPDEAEKLLTEKMSAIYSRGMTGLPRTVGLQDGFGLICVLDDRGSRFFNSKTTKEAVGKMMGLGSMRNRSFLAHGIENLNISDNQKLSEGASDLARGILQDDHAEFEVLRADLRPRELRHLWNHDS